MVYGHENNDEIRKRALTKKKENQIKLAANSHVKLV